MKFSPDIAEGHGRGHLGGQFVFRTRSSPAVNVEDKRSGTQPFFMRMMKESDEHDYDFDTDASPTEKKAMALKRMPGRLRGEHLPNPGGKELAVDSPPDHDDRTSAGKTSRASSISEKPGESARKLLNGTTSEKHFPSAVGWQEVGSLHMTKEDRPVSVNSEEDLREKEDFLSRHLPDKLFGQWWHNATVIAVSNILCWIVSGYRGDFAWVLIILSFCAAYYGTSIRRTRLHMRDDITREAAKSRLETDRETAEWINTFLVKFWVIYEPVLSATIVESVDQVLSSQTPMFLDNMRLSKFTLGTKPPRIDHVKTYPNSEDQVVLMDWKISFTPNDTLDLTARQLTTKVNPKIVLALRVGKGVISKEFPILLEDISFSGFMRVKMNLMVNNPHIKTVDISFLERPSFEYVLKPIGGETFGFDIGIIPGLSKFISEQIHSNLGPMMYNPNVFTINVEQLLTGTGSLDSAIGVMEVRVHSARNLKFSGHPDPYIMLAFANHDELARTKVVKGNEAPIFHETKYLLVNNLNDDLILQILDYNDYRKDRVIGNASFETKKLEVEPEHENIVAPVIYNGKIRGECVFDVRFFPTIEPIVLDDGSREPLPEVCTGIVRFTVHQAKDLDFSKSLVGKLSPYAVMLLNGKEVHITKKLRRTNFPVWEDSYEFLVTNRLQCQLGVMIKDDRNLATDPVLGTFDIKLDDFLEEMENEKEWFVLSNCKRGRIRLAVQWKPVMLPGGLASAQTYRIPVGVLRLHIHAGHDLLNVEGITGGKSDPYVRVLRHNALKARTVFIPNNLDPVWNEILYIPVHFEKERFILEIMDYQNSGNDRSLGYVELYASSFLEKSEESGLYETVVDDEMRTESLLSAPGRIGKGSLDYSLAFYPTLIFEEPDKVEETEDIVTDEEKEVAPEDKSGEHNEKHKPKFKGFFKSRKKQDKIKEDNTQSRSTTDVEAVTLNMAKRNKLRFDELTKYGCGILVLHIIEGELAHKSCYFDVILDDYTFPVYTSIKATLLNMKWDTITDMFIRELEFSQLKLRLKTRTGKTIDEGVVASFSGETLQMLGDCYKKPTELTLRGKDGKASKVTISLRYLPILMDLDPRESITNMGTVKIDIVSGKNLPAGDRSGKSDPYCKFYVDEEKVYHTEIKKKTLNPVWNESFEVQIRSRTDTEFKVDVYDWDFGGSSDFLGSAIIPLTDLEPFTFKSLKLPLKDASGFLNMQLLFRPGYVTRVNRTLTSVPTRALTAVAGVPVRGATMALGGAATLGTGAIHGASHVAGSAGGLVKSVFKRRHKSGDGQKVRTDSVSSNNVENRANLLAEQAALSGGGVKATSGGDVLAVGRDNEQVKIA